MRHKLRLVVVSLVCLLIQNLTTLGGITATSVGAEAGPITPLPPPTPSTQSVIILRHVQALTAAQHHLHHVPLRLERSYVASPPVTGPTAPFVTESFKNSQPDNGGWVFGGYYSPYSAYLTSGKRDSYGLNDAVGNGWLRLTGPVDTQNVGYAYYNKPFTLGQTFTINFDYACWGGGTYSQYHNVGADGTSFFLFDGASSYSGGGWGGALGYEGSNGYLGVGLDEYGGFSNGNGGPGYVGNAAVVRGSAPGDDFGTNAVNSTSLCDDVYGHTTRPSSLGAGYEHFQIIITPGLLVTVQVQSSSGGSLQTLINAFNFGTLSGQATLPHTLKFGFAGSVGAGSNAHEIRNVVVQAATPLSTAENQGPGSPSLLHNACAQNGAYPVNCASGDFWHSFTDLTIPGRGIPLEFGRTYDSLAAAQNGPLGYGWTDPYSMSLTTDTTNVVTVTEETGSSVTFALSGTTYIPPSRVLASLTNNGDGTFTFTRDQDRQQFVFTAPTTTAIGQLLREVDRNGYTTTLTYTSGLLSSVTDPAGRALTFSYNGAGQIASVRDPLSRTVSFGYDVTGNMTSTTDAAGNVTHYTYDANHRMLTMTDPRNGTVTNQYDGNGRVIQQTDPLSQTTLYTYTVDSTGVQTTTITDTRGFVTNKVFVNNLLTSLTKGVGTPQQATWSYTYDPVTLGMTSSTDPNGHTTYQTWDNQGNLLSRTDSLSRTTTYTYDALNDVTSVTDPLSVTTVMTYDVNGNLLATARPLTQTGQVALTTQTYDPLHPGDVISRTDPTSGSAAFTYDQYGDLIKSVDPLSRTTTYTYDPIGRLTSRVSPRGNVQGANPISFTTTMTEDVFGQTTAITDALGNVTRYQYDADQNLITTTDALSRTTVNGYDADNQKISVTRSDGTNLRTAYDGAGNVISTTDALSHTTLFAYDPLNRLITTTDPLSETTVSGYDPAGNRTSLTDALGRTTLYGFDAANEETTITRTDGAVLRTLYDADSRVISTTDALSRTTLTFFDSLNRVMTTTDPLLRSTSHTYDLAGRLLSTTDPLLHTTSYGYDAAGQRTSVTQPDGGINRTGYDADGNVISTTDALTHTTTYGYDPLERVITTTDPLTRTTSYTYDPVGNRLTVTDPLGRIMTTTYDLLDRVIAVTNPLSQTTRTTYDLMGNRTSVTDPLGHATSYGYDVLNRVITTTDPLTHTTVYTYDAVGNRTMVADALNHVTVSAYDVLNRVISITDPLTHTSVYTYDAVGNQTAVTDPLSRTTSTGYDADNEPITVTLANGHTQLTAYDAAGNVISTTDPLGRITHYEYDPVNREISTTDTLTRTTNYTYDLVGNRTSMTSPMTGTTSYRYDADNELSGITYSGTNTPPVTETYTATGQRATMIDGTGTTTYSYDLLDRPISITNGLGATIGYSYDAAGNLTKLTYPDTSPVTRTYDAANRLTGITDWLGHTTTYTYDAANNLITQTYPLTNTTAAWTYDAANQNTKLVEATHIATWTFIYNRNPLGQISSDFDPVVNQQHTYGYNNLNQLSSDQGTTGVVTTTTVYTPDTGYELLQIVTPTIPATTTIVNDQGYQLALQQTVSGTTTTQSLTTTYNLDGDRASQLDSSSGISTTFGYDVADRLIYFKRNTTLSTTYSYNGDGLRMSKLTGGSSLLTTTWDTAEPDGTPLIVQDGTTRYITGPDGLPVEQISGTGTVTYYLHDQLGSTRGLLNAAGQAVGTFTYSPYGTLISSTGTMTTPFGYAGQYTDAESGLQYLRARYYDPTTAVFLSRDPLVDQTGQPYAYTSLDPINATDPTGTFCIYPDGAINWAGSNCSQDPQSDYGPFTQAATTAADQFAKFLARHPDEQPTGTGPLQWVAYAAGGISRSTLEDWAMQQAAAEHSPCVQDTPAGRLLQALHHSRIWFQTNAPTVPNPAVDAAVARMVAAIKLASNVPIPLFPEEIGYSIAEDTANYELRIVEQYASDLKGDLLDRARGIYQFQNGAAAADQAGFDAVLEALNARSLLEGTALGAKVPELTFATGYIDGKLYIAASGKTDPAIIEYLQKALDPSGTNVIVFGGTNKAQHAEALLYSKAVDIAKASGKKVEDILPAIGISNTKGLCPLNGNGGPACQAIFRGIAKNIAIYAPGAAVKLPPIPVP